MLFMLSYWESVQTLLLALTCYAKESVWDFRDYLLRFSLLVWSQNADIYEVPKLSNFSTEGCLYAGEAQFHQLAKLIAKQRPFEAYFYSVSKVMGQQEGMGINSVSAFGQCDSMLSDFMKSTVHMDVPLVKPIHQLSFMDEAHGLPA